MKQFDSALQCYNQTARAYAGAFLDELKHKPLDQLLLPQFAAENKDKGMMADLGCGPGQTTRFLYEAGVSSIIGIDLSPEMIRTATELNVPIRFQAGNMLSLEYPDGYFGSVVAFYAVVHFSCEELAAAVAEVFRVLKQYGQFLFSFHVGEETIHVEEFLNERVNIDFHFFDVDCAVDIAVNAGFIPIDTVIRYPYANREHPSKRAYLLVQK